jgi:hypothetical protein
MTFPQAPQFGQQAPVAPQFTPPMPPATQAPAVNPGSWVVGAAQDAGGNGVTMAHLHGRTVAIVPLELLRDQAIRNQPGKFQNVIKADILILDGPVPFTFGGSPNGKPVPTPDTMRVDQLPFLAENSRIYGAVIVGQLESKVGRGVSVGKVQTMTTGSGNTAWTLSTDATPEQLAFVQAWAVQHYQHKQWQNPPVVMLAGPQAHAGMPMQQSAAPAFNYGPAQPMGGQQYNFQPQVPQAPVNFQPPAAPVMDWTLTTMPPGVPAEQLSAWQTQTNREQREQMLAAAGITGPNPGQPTGL